MDHSQTISRSLRSFIVIPWKELKTGEQWALYDEVVQTDPLLKERLQPFDNFEVAIRGYKYWVKASSEGSMKVFRTRECINPPYTNSMSIVDSRELSSNKCQNPSIRDTNKQDQLLLSNNNYKTQLTAESNSTIVRFVDLRLVKVSHFFLEQGWEIHPCMPICLIKSEPYIVLVQKENTRNELEV